MHRRTALFGIGGGLLLGGSPLGLFSSSSALAAGQRPKPEKKSLIIGMDPTICATPIIMAQQLGLFKKYGFENITIVRSGSPPLMAEQLQSGAFDLAQQFMPIPLLQATTAKPNDDIPVMISNLGGNGAALVMSLKRANSKDPKTWRGFRIGVPSLQSYHALMFRYLIAEHGLDPDIDVTLRVVSQNEVSAQLRGGLIDGHFGSEPAGQLAVFEDVGFIHTLSRDIWPGHSCCALTAYAGWIRRNPNTFSAAVRAVVEATAYAAAPQNRAEVVATISKHEYLDLPEAVADQLLVGPFADGLGKTAVVADRTLFDSYPNATFAIWTLTQLKRWGILRGDIKYADVVRRAILESEIRNDMTQLGITSPAAAPSSTVMGRSFDPSKPDDYIAQFRIRRQ